MTTRMLAAAGVIGVLLCAAPVRADVPPEPSRPTWQEEPAPLPEPPPEKEPVLAALAMVSAALVLGWRALRSPRRAAQVD